MSDVLIAKRLRKRYEPLHGASFTFSCEELRLGRGEVVALQGRSGSGKTTLLQMLGLLMSPDSGSLRILDTETSGMTRSQSAAFRTRHIGIVFQAYNLLPQLDALHNVALPSVLPARESLRRAAGHLEAVGLEQRQRNRPGELSGGEQQRVAFARALMNEPDLMLADEPTGNLDADSERVLLKLFREYAGSGHAVLIVTHDQAVADIADTRHMLADGVLSSGKS